MGEAWRNRARERETRRVRVGENRSESARESGNKRDRQTTPDDREEQTGKDPAAYGRIRTVG